MLWVGELFYLVGTFDSGKEDLQKLSFHTFVLFLLCQVRVTLGFAFSALL